VAEVLSEDEAERQLARFWTELSDSAPLAEAEARLLSAVGDLPIPRVLFERASLRDFLGLEEDAVPLYAAAVEGGLASPDRERAIIQWASSLRTLERSEEAEELLRPLLGHPEAGAQAAAFYALALVDLGRSREAARLALVTLASRLPEYQEAVALYADDLL
jgi:thioredoxin-like negative regulator of GroEL